MPVADGDTSCETSCAQQEPERTKEGQRKQSEEEEREQQQRQWRQRRRLSSFSNLLFFLLLCCHLFAHPVQCQEEDGGGLEISTLDIVSTTSPMEQAGKSPAPTTSPTMSPTASPSRSLSSASGVLITPPGSESKTEGVDDEGEEEEGGGGGGADPDPDPAPFSCELFSAASLEELQRGHDIFVERVTRVFPTTPAEQALVATDYNPHFQTVQPIYVQTSSEGPVLQEGRLSRVTPLFPDGFNETRQVENEPVKRYIDQHDFTATPIQGMVDSDSGDDNATVAYQALTLGPSGLFVNHLVVWVDELTTLQRLQQDLHEEEGERRQLQQQQHRQRHLQDIETYSMTCPPGQAPDDSCVDNALVTFEIRMEQQEASSDRMVVGETSGEDAAMVPQEATVEAHDLDVWRFAEIARAGAICAASEVGKSDSGWEPVLVWECLLTFLPSIQQRYLLKYTPFLRKIKVQDMAHSTQQYVWREERDDALDTCCTTAAVETATRTFFDESEVEEKTKNNSNRRRQQQRKRDLLWSTTPGHKVVTASPEATRTALTDKKKTPKDSSSLRGSSLPTSQGMEQHTFFLPTMRHNKRKQNSRVLETTSDGNDNGRCEILDFDDEKQDRLMSIVDSIFGELFSIGVQAAKAPIPTEALIVKGFDPDNEDSQVVTNPTKNYNINVQPVKVVRMDALNNILESTKETKPKRVRRLVRKYNVTATAVTATVPARDVKDFSGLLLAGEKQRTVRKNGKTRIRTRMLQFLWPADFGNFLDPEQFEQDLRSRQLREDLNSAIMPDCPNIDESCVDRANEQFQQSSFFMGGFRTQFYDDSRIEVTSVRIKHMRDYVGATIDCLSREDDWNKEMMGCVRSEKAEAINRQYVAESTRLQNEEKVAVEEMESMHKDMEMKRDEEYHTCCMNFGPVSYVIDPTIDGFFGGGQRNETTDP